MLAFTHLHLHLLFYCFYSYAFVIFEQPLTQEFPSGLIVISYLILSYHVLSHFILTAGEGGGTQACR